MYILHYIIPFVIYYLYLLWQKKSGKKEVRTKVKKSYFDLPRSKLILFGLLLGNLIDIDHIWYRILGKVDWFGSACIHFGQQCSFNFYPLHTEVALIIFGSFFVAGFHKGKKIELVGWIAAGAVLNLLLDYIHLLIGFGI